MRAFSFKIIRWIFNFVTYTLIGMKVYGEEHIPETGPFIIVFNRNGSTASVSTFHGKGRTVS